MITSAKFWFPLLPLLVYLFEFDVVPHTQFSFRCRDPNLSHVFKGDTVSARNLLLSAALGPIFIIILIEAMRKNSWKKIRFASVWNDYKKCLMGSMIVLVITQFVKGIIKEARPHFLDSCKPDSHEGCKDGTLIYEYNCMNDKLNNIEKIELTRSFPSGHTSLTVFIAVYCSYLIIRIGPPSNLRRKLAQAGLIILCVSWSSLCSISRITDRRHHWWDVAAGAIFGVLSAGYAIFLYEKDTTKMSTESKALNSTALNKSSSD